MVHWLKIADQLLAILLLSSSLLTASAQANEPYFRIQDPISGQYSFVANGRKPALFTADYSDCMASGSQLKVTRFEAAYYRDNSTVVFQLEVDSALENEYVTVHIEIFSYGKSRFDLVLDPCMANIDGLCPLQAVGPALVGGLIPIIPPKMAIAPEIAFRIPDFDGNVLLEFFSISTQSRIGCYTAVLTNGITLSHPAIAGAVLGCLALLAMVASFATAVFGNHVPTVGKHYAHSLSVLLVFATFHHFFLSGALSLNFPGILAAFWNNYAWSAGMLFTPLMQERITAFVGYDYARRDSATRDSRNSSLTPATTLLGRDVPPISPQGKWNGTLVDDARFSIPGDYSKFAGTLGLSGVPLSNAFITGFLWLLIVFAIVVVCVAALYWTTKALVRYRRLLPGTMLLFRSSWLQYTIFALLRTACFALFPLTFLALSQLLIPSRLGVKAVAMTTFVVAVVGITGSAGHSLRLGLRANHGVLDTTKAGTYTPKGKHCLFRESFKVEKLPADRTLENRSVQTIRGPFPDTLNWLTSRYREDRWWFFTVWFTYDLLRACILAGASRSPRTQVFGLLAIEILALALCITLRPYKGYRPNAIMVYCLGVSKVATLALCSALLAPNLSRISATVIGIMIIAVHCVLTLILALAILTSIAMTWISVTRDAESFRPRRWDGLRNKYLDHLRMVRKLPPSQLVGLSSTETVAIPPHFSLKSVRRIPKIEDEDQEFLADISGSRRVAYTPLDVTSTSRHPSRANSLRSITSHGHVPYGAVVHRYSWNSRDLRRQPQKNPGRQRSRMIGSSVPPSVHMKLPHQERSLVLDASCSTSQESVEVFDNSMEIMPLVPPPCYSRLLRTIPSGDEDGIENVPRLPEMNEFERWHGQAPN